MRNRLISHIKEIGSVFSTNELAFYCLTNSFELPLRDKLAYKLQQKYSKFVVCREWNHIDISIHERGKKNKFPAKSLIEIKYSFACLIMRRRDKKESYVLKSLKDQYEKDNKVCKDWHGLIFLSCPRSKVPDKYSFQVRRRSTINKHVNDYSSLSKWRAGVKEAIVIHFPTNKFIIKGGFIQAGYCFDTKVDFLWFLITKKSKAK